MPDPAICAAEPPEPVEPDGARMNGPAFAYLYDWQAHARQGWAIIERERQRRCEGAPP